MSEPASRDGRHPGRAAGLEPGVAWLVVGSGNVLALTGHWPLWGASAALVAEGWTACALPSRELELGPAPVADEVLGYDPLGEGDPTAALLAQLEPRLPEGARLGLDLPGDLSPASHAGAELRHLGRSLWVRLAERRPDLELFDCGPELERLKMRKTPAEVAAVERAAAAGEAALDEALAGLEPGERELELGARIEATFVRLALESDSRARPRAYAQPMAGPNAARAGDLVSVAGGRRLERGDLVVVELAATVDGYWADLTRTVAVGGPSPEQAGLLALVGEAQAAALAALRPGLPAGEADRAARSVIEAAGLGPRFTHGLGHGVGFAYHEPPFLRPGEATLLEAGMVLTVEPGVYAPALGGARLERDVVVTDAGCRVLGAYAPPKEDRER